LDKELYSDINLEEHQTKIPGTIMMLQALEIGIYSTWISYFKVEEIKANLKVDDPYIPSEIIAFGYPDEEIIHRNKKAIKDITFYNHFN
jgi:nitroreductase